MKFFFILIFFFILNLFIFISFDKINLFKLIVDKPDNFRKFHKKKIPLAGGIILFINIFFYFLILSFNKDLILNEIFFYNFSDLVIFSTCLFIFI